jgi:hypothetical protein
MYNIFFTGGSHGLGFRYFYQNIFIFCLYFSGTENGFALLILKTIFGNISFIDFTFKCEKCCVFKSYHYVDGIP